MYAASSHEFGMRKGFSDMADASVQQIHLFSLVVMRPERAKCGTQSGLSEEAALNLRRVLLLLERWAQEDSRQEEEST